MGIRGLDSKHSIKLIKEEFIKLSAMNIEKDLIKKRYVCILMILFSALLLLLKLVAGMSG